jgi:hypothetical protein
MHLQGLILALRAALGGAKPDLLRQACTAASSTLWYGTSSLIRNFMAAQSGCRGDTGHTQSYMYLPGDTTGAAVSSPSVLLSEMAKCDKTLSSENGRSMLSSLPDPDPSQQWTSTATTYAAALRLLAQINRKILTESNEREEQGRLPSWYCSKLPASTALDVSPVCCRSTPGTGSSVISTVTNRLSAPETFQADCARFACLILADACRHL